MRSDKDHGINEYELRIYFRKGSTLSIQERVGLSDGVTKTHKYVSEFRVGRGVDTGSHLDMTLRDIGMSDPLYLRLKEEIKSNEPYLDRYEGPISWKQVLEVGNVVRIWVNREFRGMYFVSGMRRSVNDRTTGYSVSCIGMQQWLQRQTIYFDVGGEIYWGRKNKGKKSKFIEKYAEYVKPEDFKGATTPDKAIEVIVNKLLNGFMDDIYSDYIFNDGTSLLDSIGLALSEVSYYQKSRLVLQPLGIMSGSDFSIWDQIARYRSAPFHEIWVTTGGRKIDLFDQSVAGGKHKGAVLLNDAMEYIVFRPTPYDHPAIVNESISDNGNPPIVISLGTLRNVSLHTVDATYADLIIGTDAVIDSNLSVGDDNQFSVYKVLLNGPTMSAVASDILCPPLVDREAYRMVGKRVFTAVLEGMDVGDAVLSKLPNKKKTYIDLARVLQGKAYNWFKYNSKFNKGSIDIVWLPGIYEGTHFQYSSLYDDESGMYYLNAYEMTMDHKQLRYTLNVTRGFPETGFRKNETDYATKKTDKISSPGEKTTGSSGGGSTTSTVSPPASSVPPTNKPAVKHKLTAGGMPSGSVPKRPKGTGSQRGAGGGPGGGHLSTFIVYNKNGEARSYSATISVNGKTGDIYLFGTKKKIGNIREYNTDNKAIHGSFTEWNNLQERFKKK